MDINVNEIKRTFEERPVEFLAAAGAVLMGFSKVLEAYGNYRGSAAFAKDVNRRVRMAKKQSKV